MMCRLGSGLARLPQPGQTGLLRFQRDQQAKEKPVAKYLVLYGPTHQVGQEYRFRLSADCEPDQLQRDLDQAQLGQFVQVSVVLDDDLQLVPLRLQPHLYGAWAVLDLPESPDWPAPMQAARGRQPDLRQAGMKFRGQLAH
jgi:hypothetical protein